MESPRPRLRRRAVFRSAVDKSIEHSLLERLGNPGAVVDIANSYSSPIIGYHGNARSAVRTSVGDHLADHLAKRMPSTQICASSICWVSLAPSCSKV